MTRPCSDEESIFLAAREQRDPVRRAAFLNTACNDNRLRQRVEQLLALDAAQAGPLDARPIGLAAASVLCSSEQAGSQIGPYKLLEQIGEGGFGIVFLAEQERPVRRQVALKIIKPGMDTRQVIARFEAERQALALMDHPNIAKVLDAGATDNGRPYFVMELVRGVPITEYCDTCNLTTRESLELFISVCQAVQHAHQKGIIHRDIKPSNVLVSMQDGRPVPKIIDFGVAKAMNQQLTEHTLATGFAQLIGTPMYMSPEQAELSPLGADTRSDIYSLGVLLYELLTGATPFEKDRLHKASYDELRRIIREEEPPRPSDRLSTLRADLATTVAERRRSEPHRLANFLRGELDWIVMKCLEKDRNRRYDSASALARDLERYLHDEPVQACPPSAGYRFRKFARRNNKLLAAAGAIVAALCFGIGLSTWLYFRAARESARARTVSGLLQDVLSSTDAASGKGSGYLVLEMLDELAASVDKLTDEPAAEADARYMIGRAYRSLGLPDQARPHLERALALRRQIDGAQHENVADVLIDYAWTLENLKKYGEAEQHVREALEICHRRNIPGATVIHALRILQDVLVSSSSGREAEAEKVAREAIQIASRDGEEFADLATVLHLYADIRIKQGRFAEAQELAEKAADLHRRLHPNHPETAYGLRTLGRTYEAMQKLDKAESAFRESLAIFRRCYAEEHEFVGAAVFHLRSVLNARGDEAAVAALDDEIAERAKRIDSPEKQVQLAGLLLANRPTDAQKQEARRLIRRAIDEFGKVAAVSPRHLDRRLKAADRFVEITKLCADIPEFAPEMQLAHEKLTAELKALLTDFPDSDYCLEKVGHEYRLWAAAVQNHASFRSQVADAHGQAIDLFEELLEADPNKPQLWFCMGNSYTHLGDIMRRSGRKEDPDVTYGRALRIYEEHAADIAKYSTERAVEMTAEYFRLARLLQKNKSQAENEKARRFLRAVIDKYSLEATDYPGDLNRRASALDACAQAGWYCAITPGLAGELDEINRTLEVQLPKLLSAFPDSGDCLLRTANIYRRWAVESTWDSKSLPIAERAIREAIKLHEELSLAEPKRSYVWLNVVDRNILFGGMLWWSGRPDDAEAAFRRAIEVFDQHEADIEADKSDGVLFSIVVDSIWLAYYLGATDRADEAAQFIRKAVQSARRLTKPVELALAHYFIALVQARLGDLVGYRETCLALAEVPIADADDATKVRTILTWCRAPGALTDLSVVVKLAEESAAHNAIDQRQFIRFNLGAALYRAGRYEEAAGRLQESIALYPSDPQPGERIINWQRLFLAMTKWKLGERDEARRLLAEIQPAIDEELRSAATPMDFRVTLETLRREAETLIGQKQAEETKRTQR